MSQKRDYYEVLGVSQDASADEIKRAFRKLAKKYHPDVSQVADADVRFKELNQAYEVLSSPQKRRMYDRFGHQGVDGNAGSVDPSDIFGQFSQATGGISDFFSDLFGGRTHPPRSETTRQDGQPLKATVELNLKELLFGTDIELTAKLYRTCSTCAGRGAVQASDIQRCSGCGGRGIRMVESRTPLGIIQSQTTCRQCAGRGQVNTNPCSDCHGRKRVLELRLITINLPPSWPIDQMVRVRDQGHDGLEGGQRGDIFLQIKVKPHRYFRRRNDELWLELPVTFFDAMLGSKIKVPSLDGELTHKLPNGTQTGYQFIIPGHGFFKSPRSKKRGPLVVVVNIQTPSRLNRVDRSLLEKLQSETDFQIDLTPITKF